jgi:predicted nucleic acid-binding Zn ribbon protein
VSEPFGSPAVHPCQRCGKEARRILFAPPLVFKGQGFYKTSGRGTSSASTGFEGNGSTSSNRSKTPPKKESTPAKETTSTSSDD